MAFVKRWKADGHLSAVLMDEGAVRAREVLERKAREHGVGELPCLKATRLVGRVV